MARKLNEKLLKMLAPQGEYGNILNEVIKDKELSLEIRDGKAIIYYKKGEILTLSKNNIKYLSQGYYRNKASQPEFSDEQTKQNPATYFNLAKSFVDNHGYKKEFTIQQLIASENASVNNDYLVIDMEYQYEQKGIPKNERINFTRVDLLAIEKESKDIVLFELKQSTDSLKGKSGVEEHVQKSKTLIEDEKCAHAILEDVRTIVEQKVELKLLPEEAKNYIKENANIKPMFIFVYSDEKEKEEYDAIPKNDVPTIYFNFRYILKKPE